MSKQLALSIAVSVMAMVSFVLLGQEAGAQLAREARSQMPLTAEFSPMPKIIRLLPNLH